MAMNISFKRYQEIVNNEEYDQSFRSLLKILFITGLRINEASKLINLVKEHSEVNTISFKGKMGIIIDQDIIPEIKKEVFLIKNKWKNEASIGKSIWRWNKKYNLEIEAHAIRRLSATLIDKNLDTRHAQALLNHVSVATTERYIEKVSKFEKKNLAQRVLIEISIKGEDIKTLGYLREQVLHLENKLKDKDQEVKNLKSKLENQYEELMEGNYEK